MYIILIPTLLSVVFVVVGVGDSPIFGLVLFITVSCKHGDGEPLASGDIQW